MELKDLREGVHIKSIWGNTERVVESVGQEQVKLVMPNGNTYQLPVNQVLENWELMRHAH